MQTREPITREDGELIGFLNEADDAWTPVTVFGFALSEPTDRDAAESVLRAKGMSCLAEKWAINHENSWITAEIVEASPTHVIVREVDFFNHPDSYGQRHSLDAPVGDRLRLS